MAEHLLCVASMPEEARSEGIHIEMMCGGSGAVTRKKEGAAVGLEDEGTESPWNEGRLPRRGNAQSDL